MKALRTLMLIVFFALFSVNTVQAAGNDLTVICTDASCTITEGDLKLFDSSNIYPGQTFTQNVTVTTNTTNSVVVGMEIDNLIPTPAVTPHLADKLFFTVNEGSDTVYGGTGKTLQEVFTDGLITLGSFSPAQTKTYQYVVEFDPDADDAYQARSSQFDLSVGFETISVTSTPTPTPGSQVQGLTTSSSSSSGGGGGGDGGTPPVCSSTSPTSAPSLTFSEQSTADGQVTLSWSAVGGVTHYGINFGITSGSYIYGAANVGNSTTYTVTGLAPGAQYFFQVIPFNDCASGPRSNEASTGGALLAAGTLINPPGGFTDQVLGEATEEATPSDENTENGENGGDILGDSTCSAWKQYLPLIMILVQVVLSIAVYFVMSTSQGLMKQGVVGAIVAGTALAFYFFKDCPCFEASFYALLCKWYIVLAVIVAGVTQFVNYALIEREG